LLRQRQSNQKKGDRTIKLYPQSNFEFLDKRHEAASMPKHGLLDSLRSLSRIINSKLIFGFDKSGREFQQ